MEKIPRRPVAYSVPPNNSEAYEPFRAAPTYYETSAGGYPSAYARARDSKGVAQEPAATSVWPGTASYEPGNPGYESIPLYESNPPPATRLAASPLAMFSTWSKRKKIIVSCCIAVVLVVIIIGGSVGGTLAHKEQRPDCESMGESSCEVGNDSCGGVGICNFIYQPNTNLGDGVSKYGCCDPLSRQTFSSRDT